MKKRLLMQLLTVVCALSTYAYTNGDYIYTPTQKLKITGENIVLNGDFADGFAGWYDTEKGIPSAETWSKESGLGPNGETTIMSNGATLNGAVCNNWELDAGTYVVMFDIKGEGIGTTSITTGATNYVDFFLTSVGDLVKSADAGDVSVATTDGFKGEWKTVSYFFSVEDGQSLTMNFSNLATGAMFTNVQLYPAVEVYDTRALERRLAYVDELVATGKFTNDENGFIDNVVNVVRGWLDENSPELDDVSNVESMLEEYDTMLLAWLNENSADLLKNEKRWSTYSDTRKANAFGNWTGSGGRWFHKNNGGGDGDEIGHRLQGGMAAAAATMHYTITPAYAGTYMFSVETQGYYMQGTKNNTAEQYYVDYNREFTGVTFYGGKDILGTDAAENETMDAVKVDGGVLNNHYYKTITVFVDVTEDMVKEQTPITFGMTYIPNPDETAAGKYGSNVQLRNPQLRVVGVAQTDYDYAEEVRNINTQQEELASRIATAQEKAAKTKADGFPWAKADLNAAIEDAQGVLEASYAFEKDGEVIDEDGIKNLLFTEGETKESAVVLNAVNAIKKAWDTYESLNASFTGLQAKVAEAQKLLADNAGKGDATRRATVETAISEAEAMIAATGEESEKDAFDAKNAEIAAAVAAWQNTLASYADPTNLPISANPESSSDKNWTWTETVSGKENFKKATQGSGWEAGYYTAVWRGNTASPQSKMVQTYTISDPGIYEFRVNVQATNEDFGKHLGMATIIDADPDNGIAADTIYNKSSVKVFLGEVGNPETDSVRTVSRLRLNGGTSNSGAGSALALFGYDANLYSVYYLKTGDAPIDVEFGLSSYGQVDGAGANCYGFGDTKLFYMGNEADFRKDMVADMTKRIAAAKAVLDANIENEAASTWTSRLQRRLVDAENALKATSTIKDLTALANATYFVEQLAAQVQIAATAGIENVTVEAANVRPAVQGVYTITGIKMGKDVQGLKPGLYIVNGKKYLVK